MRERWRRWEEGSDRKWRFDARKRREGSRAKRRAGLNKVSLDSSGTV
jgi:hypothetical protein